MMNRSILTSTAILLALLAAPLGAQQRPQDFNLPPGPTPTPVVEGPVDDSGPVPIAPLAIPTGAPAPSPVPIPPPTAAAAATPTPSSAAQATPAVQPSPRASAPTLPAPTPPQAQSLQVGSSPAASTSVLNDLPAPTPEPVVPTQRASAPAKLEPAASRPALPEWWPWAVGLFGVLLLGALGGWTLARRSSARGAPTIEPPVVSSALETSTDTASASVPARIAMTFEVERLTRSVMALTLRYRLTIANRSDQPLRDLAVSADLASARRNLPVEQQLANAATQLPDSANVERIGPHQSTSVTGELRLPISAIEVFQQGQMPLCLPLARLRVEGIGIEPHLRTFLVGLGSAGIGGRVHPLPLSGPPGGYEGAQARPLD